MANPSFNLDFTVIDDCEADPAVGWTINAGPDVDIDTYKQGSQSYSGIITRTNNGTITKSGLSIANATFFATDNHMRAWIQYTFANNLAVKADAAGGGIQFWCSDGTNTCYWNVEGRDTYGGGWKLMQTDLNATPDSGTKPTGTITSVGFKINLDVNAKNVNNFWVDYLVYGKGYDIYGGTSGDPITWDTLASTDATNGYGFVQKVDGVFFINGRLGIGDDVGTNNCYFDGADEAVVFAPNNESSGLHKLFSIGNSSATTQIALSGSFIKSATANGFNLDLSTPASYLAYNVYCDGVIFVNASSVTTPVTINNSAFGFENCTFDGCGQIPLSSSQNWAFEGNLVKNYAGTDGAILWPGDATKCLNGTLRDNTRAIEITQTVNQTFDNLSFSNNTYDVHLDNGGTSIEVSKNNGSNPSTYIATGGGTVTFVGASTSITVKAVDATGANISGARVFLRTGAAGSLPYNASVTISNSGTTATVTHTAHGLKTGDKVVIEGVTNNENRGTKTITVTGANTYTYTTTSLTASDSGNAYFVFVEGTTDVNGEISASRVYPANQAATGRVRKSSGAPYYKSSPLTGTVSATVDVTLTAVMISDD